MIARSLIIAVFILVIDQISKFWVVEKLDLKNVLRIEIFDPFLNFTMAWNTGINFGLLGGQDARYLLIGFAIAISIGILWWLRKRSSPYISLGAGLIIGGAIGNVIDRVRYGAVADFLNMSCCGIKNPFAFNIADIAIFFGAITLAFFIDKKEQSR